MTGDNVTEFNKITPETYEKMNEEFEEEGLAFESQFPHKNKSTIGETNASSNL